MRNLIAKTRSAVTDSRFNPLKYMTASGFKRTRRRAGRLQPVPNLSAASKCVWQMDREA